MQGFHDLSSSRRVGFGPSAIPFSEISLYHQRMDVMEEFQLFFRKIREVDRAFLDYSAQKQKAKNQ